MTWSGRSASPARRWWDRVARRHARRGSKIPADDRSFCVSCLYFKSRGMLMAGAFAVKADRQAEGCSKRACFAPRVAEAIVSRSRQDNSVLFFAARSEAAVLPPPRLIRFSDSRWPCVGIGARFELSVRELTPIQEISDDSRPYSIFGQRFITTLMPAASAFAAAASSRAPSCIQITFGGGDNVRASSTTGMMWLELRKMSIMSTGRPISDSEATKDLSSRLLPTCPGLTGIMS